MKPVARNLILFAQLALLAACSGSTPVLEKPELPQSVPPGWTRQSIVETPPPAGLPQTATAPQCRLAVYAGPGTAQVRLCGYGSDGQAFDAAQRFPTAANTVKFQVAKWFVLVNWDGASQADATALVRAVQRALK